MDVEALRRQWLEEERHAFTGWDFCHLDGRWVLEDTPWDYGEAIRSHLRPEHRLLDMGTGDGEFLLTLGHPPENTEVTEGWAPNIQLCMENLAPLGIRVHPVHGDAALPIEGDSIDIVINRHESFDPEEIHRVLKPGGLMITQQVGGRDQIELARRINLGAEPLYDPERTLDDILADLKSCGLAPERWEECRTPCRFLDVGAVVFFAKVIVWTFPGFSVEKCFPQLLELQEELEEKGYIETTEQRFLIVARAHK